MQKTNFLESKFNKIHKYYNSYKNVLVFYIILLTIFVFLVIGISLLASSSGQYSNYVSINKKIFELNQSLGSLTGTEAELVQSQIIALQGTIPDIAMFIYGLFFMVMSVVLIVLNILFGNSTFNKKLNEKK